MLLVCRELRRTVGSAVLEAHVEALKVTPAHWPLHVLGQHIRRVHRAGNLTQRKLSSPEFVLDPQVRHIQVADSPQPLSASNADSSGGVAPKDDVKLYAEVLRDASETQCMGGACDQA